MQKRSDQMGAVSWQDALQLWTEVMRHYGVVIELEHGQCTKGKNNYCITASLTVKQLTGQKGFSVIHRRLVAYPSPHASTYPATLVYHLSAVALVIEKLREDEKRRVEQLPLFAAGD